MSNEKAKLRDFEVEEFAGVLCSLPDGTDSDAIEQALYDKFEISLEHFQKLMEHLVPFCMVAESPLTHNVYQGFAKDGMWHLKHPLPVAAPAEATAEATVPG